LFSSAATSAMVVTAVVGTAVDFPVNPAITKARTNWRGTRRAPVISPRPPNRVMAMRKSFSRASIIQSSWRAPVPVSTL
jgi:hypothetical protein